MLIRIFYLNKYVNINSKSYKILNSNETNCRLSANQYLGPSYYRSGARGLPPLTFPGNAIGDLSYTKLPHYINTVTDWKAED